MQCKHKYDSIYHISVVHLATYRKALWCSALLAPLGGPATWSWAFLTNADKLAKLRIHTFFFGIDSIYERCLSLEENRVAFLSPKAT